jgi:hypothetical protein
VLGFEVTFPSHGRIMGRPRLDAPQPVAPRTVSSTIPPRRGLEPAPHIVGGNSGVLAEPYGAIVRQRGAASAGAGFDASYRAAWVLRIAWATDAINEAPSRCSRLATIADTFPLSTGDNRSSVNNQDLRSTSAQSNGSSTSPCQATTDCRERGTDSNALGSGSFPCAASLGRSARRSSARTDPGPLFGATSGRQWGKRRRWMRVS